MGKLPQHVPFFTHSPPIFLHFSFFLEHFHTFSMMYCNNALFSPIFPHFPPFSPFFRGLPETGRPPETETAKAWTRRLGVANPMRRERDGGHVWCILPAPAG